MTRPLRNRVNPLGEIVAVRARGAWTGNRGALATAEGALGQARWRLKAWITCVLHWKDNSQPLMTPRTWTPLFFLDEATALAAGHRPCAYCRRSAFLSYAMSARPNGRIDRLRAPEIDAQLHQERLIGRTRQKRLIALPIDDLPDGAMFMARTDTIYLLDGDVAFPWSFTGYGSPLPRPTGTTVSVITPPLSLHALMNGYKLMMDRSVFL